MINLIRNELSKIFHKKGIYIVLLITTLFCFLTNYIYSIDLMNTDFEKMNYNLERDYVESLEKEHNTKSSEYIESKAYVETYEYATQFGYDSWQKVVLLNDSDYALKISDIYRRIVSYETGYTKDVDDYKKALSEKDELTDKIENLTSSEYTESLLEEITKDVKEDDYLTKAKIETLNMRLDYNISFANNTANELLDTYENNRILELQYESRDYESLKQEEKENLKRAKSEVATASYKIKNQIIDDDESSLKTSLTSFYSDYFIMIIVIIVLVAGSIVSDEFSKGTIKLLLVRPYSRITILMSKYITTLIMIVFAIVATLGIELIVGGVFFGYNSLNIPYIVYNYASNMVVELNIFKYLFINTIAVLPQLILIATLAFSLSTIFTSTSLANTLTIIGVFGSDIINLIAQQFEIDILKFFVTLHWDFTPYLFGGTSPYKGVTLPLSIIVCLVYWLIMIIGTSIVFQKRNIKNV